VLRPGGTFPLADITGDGLVGWIVERAHHRAGDGHEEFPSSARVVADMAVAGFEQAAVARFGHYRLIRGRR
jgi:hypothetical protein